MQTRILHRIENLLKVLSVKVVAISILFFAALYIFGIIIDEVVYEKKEVFDTIVFSYFSSISTPNFIAIMKVFTFFGSQMFLLPAYILLISYYVFTKKVRNGIDIAIISLSSSAIMFALKQITHRKRPDLPIIPGITNYSFPSGHALSIFIFSSIILHIIWSARLPMSVKWLNSIVLFLFTITVGVSRIALRVHYPTDVAASFCLGIIWVILSFWLLDMISKKKKLILEQGNDEMPAGDIV